MSELWKLTAQEAVALLKKREVAPRELVDAAAARIESTNSRINAMVTLCLERAREHAVRMEKIDRSDLRPPR